MKKLQLWQSLPCVFLASGCFYTYNNYYSPDGGAPSSSAGAVSSGGSSSGGGSTSTGQSSAGGSSSGSVSSTGSGSTGGSSTSGGSSGGSSGVVVCGPPPDGGWPLNCSKEEQIYLNRALTSMYPMSDLSIVPLPGGSYLVGILTGPFSDGAQFLTIAPDGTVSDAGIQGCFDQTNNSDCPNVALSLVSAGPGVPPTMVAGYFPPNSGGDFTDELACWSPYNSTKPVALSLASVGPTAVDVSVGLLRAASVAGQIAIAVTDYYQGQDVLALGPAAGGCPVAASAKLLSSSAVAGFSIAPSGIPAIPFLTAEAVTGPDDLNLALVPGGAASMFAFGAITMPNLYWPAVASDGRTFAALTSSDQDGIQLFTGSLPGLSPIFDGGTLSPAPAFALSATSCGPGCALAGWVVNAGGPDGGPETPTFALINAEGCANYVTFASFTDDTARTALTAVAAQPGSVAIAYASTYANSGNQAGRVNLRLCKP